MQSFLLMKDNIKVNYRLCMSQYRFNKKNRIEFSKLLLKSKLHMKSFLTSINLFNISKYGTNFSTVLFRKIITLIHFKVVDFSGGIFFLFLFFCFENEKVQLHQTSISVFMRKNLIHIYIFIQLNQYKGHVIRIISNFF